MRKGFLVPFFQGALPHVDVFYHAWNLCVWSQKQHAPCVPSMSPDVVGVLGIQVLHESGHGILELGPSSWGAFERCLFWIPFRKQGPEERVPGLPHGLGQVSEEQVIVLVNEAVDVIGHLCGDSTWSGASATLCQALGAPGLTVKCSRLPSSPVSPPRSSVCAQTPIFTIQAHHITLPA